MLRGLMMTGLLMAVWLEPLTDPQDLPHYAVTQGGLLCVVLVLLWYIRELHRQTRIRDAALLTESREQSDALIALVGQANATMQRVSSSCESLERAIDRQAIADTRPRGRRSLEDAT